MKDEKEETYIPHNNSSRLPFDPDMEVSTVVDVVIEEFENGVAFFFFVANDIFGDLEQGFGQHVMPIIVSKRNLSLFSYIADSRRAPSRP